MKSEYAQKCKDTYWYQHDAKNDQERLDLVKQNLEKWKQNDLKYSHPKKAREIEEDYKRELSWLASDIKAMKSKIKDMEFIQKAVQKYGSVPYSEMAQMLDENELDDLRYYLFHYHFNDK